MSSAYPTGKPVYNTDVPKPFVLNYYFGIVSYEVTPPERLYLPVLPYTQAHLPAVQGVCREADLGVHARQSAVQEPAWVLDFGGIEAGCRRGLPNTPRVQNSKLCRERQHLIPLLHPLHVER